MSYLAETIRCFGLCLIAWASLLPATGAERPSVLFLNIDDWNDWNSVLKGIRRRSRRIWSASPRAVSLSPARFVPHPFASLRGLPFSPDCTLRARAPSRTAMGGGLGGVMFLMPSPCRSSSALRDGRASGSGRTSTTETRRSLTNTSAAPRNRSPSDRPIGISILPAAGAWRTCRPPRCPIT